MGHLELTGQSNWSTFISKNVYANKKFQLIVEFYLFNCPVTNTSIRGKSFVDYGWKSKDLSKLSKKLRNANDNKVKFYRVAIKDLYMTLQSTKQLESINYSQEIVIYHNHSNSIDTLFSAIRNAFAHGSYNIITKNKIRYYCFENRQSGKKNYYNKEIRARILLKEDTLIKWINIIQSGP